jgi:transcriptional regulator with XRE-family HTH domain
MVVVLNLCDPSHMDAASIKSLREAMGLTPTELAKALNIAVFTVRRWETGQNEPTGLQSEVLQALRSVVGRMPIRARDVGDQLRLGLGAMIFQLLTVSMERIDAAAIEGPVVVPGKTEKKVKGRS